MAENPGVVSTLANTIERPLCVDLDGTLVKSDTLTDSVLLLARKHPVQLLRAPLWLAGGKAAFKAEVTSRVALDVEHLPWNHKLLEYLAEQRAAGRKIYLATGADLGMAQRVADHLGMFDGVLASDGATNQTGDNKLATLRGRFAEQGFDYVGNASPDVPVLAASGAAMVANPTRALQSALRSRKIAVSRSFEDRGARGASLLKAIRLHQWTKNVLIFVPLLLAHVLKLQLLATAALAFLSFSLCASATYIVNDMLDMDADRRHSRKRLRPFAAGDLSALTGAGMVVVLLAAAFTGAAFLPHAFLWWLLVYLVSTLAYSLWLKRVVLVDVLLLSGLYTLRLLAGAGAVGVRISPWFAAFSIFLFLSLAIVKRFSELENIRVRGGTLANGRGYLLTDIEQLRSFGTMSGLGAVVIFALYINGADIVKLYRHPTRMWLIMPLLILWIFRVWLLASRGELDEDPVIFAVTDRMSLLIGAAIAVIAALATV
ncbi:MAG TPA: UbiA family prenyltransferase [Acidobacteriaceae bacterium]|nr:UbiA family prenyltransferase [Acidobacteriaceae bacterium]